MNVPIPRPRLFLLHLAVAGLAGVIPARPAEYHVAPSGNDAGPGSAAAPFRTIQRGAEAAHPGDTITVHAGLYREYVNPPRGGTSETERIVYRAAPGEAVEIRGSEPVKGWTRAGNDTWTVTLPNSFFGRFNPYADLIRGDWFKPKDREHHTGAVYLEGEWLDEAAKLEDVLAPTGGAAPLWFARVDEATTTIWAQFKGIDPNRRLVEINVRRAVFYPDAPGRDYITVRGFTMRHAATPWAPPTAEQVGLIGTHWSKGWIIEGNVVSHSRCSGIALGKYGDRWDNTSANSAEGYVKTIERALANGWHRDKVGHHVVRDNTVSHCEQAGIVGSLGPAFSRVTGNTIHDIHVRALFTGAEMAGIKFHAAIDVEICGNHIYRTCRGLWLDWMAQGTRVSRNLIHDSARQDLFVEVNHGPFLVDNNVFLSPQSILTFSRGGAYVHNLMAGSVDVRDYDKRLTPFLKPHSTALAGMHDNPSGDERYFNNLLIGAGDLSPYDRARLPVVMQGNVFVGGAKPCRHEVAPLLVPKCDPALRLLEQGDATHLEMRFDPAWIRARVRGLITSDTLGQAAIPKLPFVAPDDSPIRIDTDYFGKRRDESAPTPGPFEAPGAGALRLKLR